MSKGHGPVLRPVLHQGLPGVVSDLPVAGVHAQAGPETGRPVGPQGLLVQGKSLQVREVGLRTLGHTTEPGHETEGGRVPRETPVGSEVVSDRGQETTDTRCEGVLL